MKIKFRLIFIYLRLKSVYTMYMNFLICKIQPKGFTTNGKLLII